MGVFFEIAEGANYSLLPSTQPATIRPGTASMARSAFRARSSRLRSLTCGAKRKIGAVTKPRPIFDREATAPGPPSSRVPTLRPPSSSRPPAGHPRLKGIITFRWS